MNLRKVVLYGGTRNLYEAMYVSVRSLLANTSIDRVILLIEDDEFPYQMPGCVQTMNVFGQTLFPPDGANYKCRWTYMSMMRLAAAKMFPDEDIMLWLDCDTIVDADISELFSIDMTGCFFAGVKEIKKSFKRDYINAGVLLMNLAALRESATCDWLIDLVNTQKLELPDQDAINMCAPGRIILLDSKYNVCEFTEPPTEQKIIHFAARLKFDNDPLYRKYSGIPYHTRTLIAVPTYGAIDPDFMKSFVDLQKDDFTSYAIIKNALIYNARNTIAREAIRHGFDRVLWLDSDVTVPPDALIKLSQDMDNGLDFVSGVYFMKTMPTKPVVYSDVWYEVTSNEASAGATNIEQFEDVVFEIGGSGFGCVMTSVLMLKKLVERYGAPFTPMMGLGEDIAFCWRAKQNGYKLFCDGRVKCGHIGKMVYDESIWKGQQA